jgi:S1-C subfamily serine protease
MSDLVVALRRYEPGDDVTLTVHRGGVVRDIEVTLAERDQ